MAESTEKDIGAGPLDPFLFAVQIMAVSEVKDMGLAVSFRLVLLSPFAVQIMAESKVKDLGVDRSSQWPAMTHMRHDLVFCFSRFLCFFFEEPSTTLSSSSRAAGGV